jgi:5-methyltetrahydropteroyltriglutamate--homocysteine methyltransferase
MTICDTIADEHYGRRSDMAMAFAEILNAEARELAAIGVDVIQFDEPAFNVFMDDVREWGIAALHRAIEGLACTTAVHICYGYGIEENLRWKETLGREWRQYEEIFPLLNASRIDQVSLECADSKVPATLMALLKDKGIMVGVVAVTPDTRRNPGGGRGHDPPRHAVCRSGAALPMLQLRHGADPLPDGAGQDSKPGGGAALVRKAM